MRCWGEAMAGGRGRAISVDLSRVERRETLKRFETTWSFLLEDVEQTRREVALEWSGAE